MSSALVSVIMPVYNCASYLEEAVASILNQSHSDLELIAIDDCSSDNSATLLQQFSQEDSRVKVFQNRENLGVTKTLNRVRSLVSGTYVARMDADDIAALTRFEEQLDYLDKNPQTMVLGTGYIRFSNHDKNKKQVPTNFKEVNSHLLFGNPVGHGTVMCRRETYDSDFLYSETYGYAEDYHLWVDLVPEVKIENLKQPLYHLRLHETSVSTRNSKEQDSQAGAISVQAVGNFCSHWGSEDLALYRSTLLNQSLRAHNEGDMERFLLLLADIYETARTSPLHDEIYLRELFILPVVFTFLKKNAVARHLGLQFVWALLKGLDLKLTSRYKTTLKLILGLL